MTMPDIMIWLAINAAAVANVAIREAQWHLNLSDHAARDRASVAWLLVAWLVAINIITGVVIIWETL